MQETCLEETHVRKIKHTPPLRILIANSKGGCGKTTLATNLACYFVNEGQVTSLLDYDPQGSSSFWLDSRPSHAKPIHGVDAFRNTVQGSTRSWQLKVPYNTQRIVIDTPAGLCGGKLDDLIHHTDLLLIPVLPSAIDIKAATGFIRDVLLSTRYRSKAKPIAVIANRAKQNTLVYKKLESFLSSLKIPFITTLRDTQYYVRTTEQGLGIHDLKTIHHKDKHQWRDLMHWIEKNTPNS